MRFERVASCRLEAPYGVNALDHARTHFAVTDRNDGLFLVDGRTLAIRHRWRLGEDAIGTHAIRPDDRFALISGRAAVTLIDGDGRPIWEHRHVDWSGDYERGIAWFDDAGRPFALVLGDGGCEVVALSPRDGTIEHHVGISTAPAGADAIHQPGGWVGLSVGEGQDGVYAWWARLTDRLELIQAPWSDEVLFDCDPLGQRILTTPHNLGPIRIRSFPGLDLLAEVEAPPSHDWDFYACFAGDRIVARAHNPDNDHEILLCADGDPGKPQVEFEGPVIPGPDASWIATTTHGLERWRLSAT